MASAPRYGAVGARLKMAVTVLFPFITTCVVALVPLALPAHWLKTKPWVGRARRWTVAPSTNVHRRKPPRKSLCPDTALRLADTSPLPAGDTAVVSVRVTGAGVGDGIGAGVGLAVKLALTVLALVIVTVQTLPLIESHPVQLPKVCVLLAVAMTLTTVFAAREPVQLTMGPLVLPVRSGR